MSSISSEWRKRALPNLSSRSFLIAREAFEVGLIHNFFLCLSISCVMLYICLGVEGCVSSFAGMQSPISKINTEVLKSVISSGSVNHGCESGNPIPSKVSVSGPSSPALPVYTPTLRYSIISHLFSCFPLSLSFSGTMENLH